MFTIICTLFSKLSYVYKNLYTFSSETGKIIGAIFGGFVLVAGPAVFLLWKYYLKGILIYLIGKISACLYKKKRPRKCLSINKS